MERKNISTGPGPKAGHRDCTPPGEKTGRRPICWPSYAAAFLVFLLTAMLYFSPQYAGKEISMHDMTQYSGMSKEISDHKDAYGEDPQWTGAMFGGMPAELISMEVDSPVLKGLNKAVEFPGRPAAFIFLAMAAFFLMLLMFGINPWIAIIPSLAYGLSTYFFLIIGAGHITKMIALAYAPLMVGGVAYAFRRNMWLGAALTALFGALEIWANHPQITYYFLFVIAAYWINELIVSLRAGTLPRFARVTGLLAVAAILAVGANTAKLWYVNESGKYSTRGGSELASPDNGNSEGLDLDYATHWSYGKAESFNLYIPNFMGGSDQGGFSADGPVADQLSRYGARHLATQLPGYWGPQPSTVGPTYLGAVMVYLFVLGLLVLRGRNKWWVLGVSVLALMLAWGRNFLPFTELFFNYFPGYDKFRTVSMILVVVQWSVPFLAAIVLSKVWQGEPDGKKIVKSAKTAFYITGGIALFFLLFATALFDFTSPKDAYYGLPDDVVRAMWTERASLFRMDCFRSLVFVALTTGVVWLFAAGKMKKWLLVVALAALVLADMVPVDLRYLPRSRFVEKTATAIRPSAANLEIMEDPQLGFRVLDLSRGRQNIGAAFNDATASYFHRSVGGYHGAKMQRYQDIIERHIYRGNMEVLNMLNTCYFIEPDENGRPVALWNPDANGAAWFVSEVVWAEGPQQEIDALDTADTKTTAVIDRKFSGLIPASGFSMDTTSGIELTEYRANYLKYEYCTPSASLAVFSEIFYDKGWTAFVDGVETPHFRADYILRAMVLPEGCHTVEFKYEAAKFKALYTSSRIFTWLIIIFAGAATAGTIICRIKRRKYAGEQTA